MPFSMDINLNDLNWTDSRPQFLIGGVSLYLIGGATVSLFSLFCWCVFVWFFFNVFCFLFVLCGF